MYCCSTFVTIGIAIGIAIIVSTTGILSRNITSYNI